MTNNQSSTKQRDARVLELYEQLLEIEQRLIPTGLHVFGEPGDNNQRADMLRMVASFDRPEFGTQALPNLIDDGLKIRTQDVSNRERIDQIASQAVTHFVTSGMDSAISYLQESAASGLIEAEVQSLAMTLRQSRTRIVVIDTQQRFESSDETQRLADSLNAQFVKLSLVDKY